MIERHRPLKRVDRRRRLLQVDKAATPLLMQAAEARVVFLEFLQSGERVGVAAKISQRDCRQQLYIAQPRFDGQQRVALRERRGELPLP